ncbi:serine/threonine-protein kinase SAPK3 isoform X1 [Brassica napus]|uniref:serine/threonine-protein kinase SAPK3 isoform X1 n=1 Tax=Brassica napus TaxID=3708 RepID=UPI000BBEAD0A|nr:serine/threonine-protein kinase SAPK3 isoform X1 [Brassica napus]
MRETHLAIVMEYAARGELYKHIRTAGRFSEDDARYLFQPLISAVSYCHAMDCIHLLSLIFIATPVERISIADIKKTPMVPEKSTK